MFLFGLMKKHRQDLDEPSGSEEKHDHDDANPKESAEVRQSSFDVDTSMVPISICLDFHINL